MASLCVVEDIKNALNQAAWLVPDDYRAKDPHLEQLKPQLRDLMSFVPLCAQLYCFIIYSRTPLAPQGVRRGL